MTTAKQIGEIVSRKRFYEVSQLDLVLSACCVRCPACVRSVREGNGMAYNVGCHCVNSKAGLGVSQIRKE